MNSSSKDAFEKTASQYERKLARQRQLELMEAAASGTTPGMELDTTCLQGDGAHNISGLRSRNETARRFLSDEDEAVSQLPKPQLHSPVKTVHPTSAKSLFDLRGRPDGLPVNTGLNLMDHHTGVYREQTKSERMMSNIRGLFSAKTGTETHFDADAPADDFAEYSSNRRTSKRQSGCSAFCRSLWHDRKRRAMVLFFTATLIFIVLVSVTTVRLTHPTEKAVRQQNTIRLNTIMDHIVAEGISNAAAFLDSASPENHALRWVAYSDPAKLAVDDPMLVVRYALATFFYNSYLTFEMIAGRQKPVEMGEQQWEGVPNPGWVQKDYWLTEKGVCQWYGVHCDPQLVTNPTTGENKNITQYDKDDHPTALEIRKNHLVGQLVPELKALTKLKVLNLASNKLAGSFPTNLGRLFNLEALVLSDNKFTGSLTKDFGFLEGIKVVNLGKNAFTGQLPTELNRLYRMETLQLSNNSFTGSIPDLTDCLNLKKLHLENNGLNSVFPFTLALQLNLTEIYVNNNQLKGTIPAEIESIRGLEMFHAESNEIEGVIPKGMFGRMSHLREAAFDNNKMTGKVPSDTSAMVQLQLLSLSGNSFTGPLPDTWGRVSTLQKLHLSDNDLTGTLPTTLGSLTSIIEVWLEGNSFKGQIPSQLSKCVALETLFLDRNMLTGGVPKELGSLTGLKTIRIQENDINGNIPSEICNLESANNLIISADCKAKVVCTEGCCSECH